MVCLEPENVLLGAAKQFDERYHGFHKYPGITWVANSGEP